MEALMRTVTDDGVMSKCIHWQWVCVLILLLIIEFERRRIKSVANEESK